MFLSRYKKIMHTPVNPIFTIIKEGLKGSKLYRYVFLMLFYCFLNRHENLFTPALDVSR